MTNDVPTTITPPPDAAANNPAVEVNGEMILCAAPCVYIPTEPRTAKHFNTLRDLARRKYKGLRLVRELDRIKARQYQVARQMLNGRIRTRRIVRSAGRQRVAHRQRTTAPTLAAASGLDPPADTPGSDDDDPPARRRSRNWLSARRNGVRRG